MDRYDRQSQHHGVMSGRQDQSQPDRLRWEPIETQPTENAVIPSPPAEGCPACARRRGAIGMLVIGGAVAVLFHNQIGAFLETMRWAGDSRSDQRFIGFMAYGFTVIAILGAIKIFAGKRS